MTTSPLMPVEEALTKIIASAQPLAEFESVSLLLALGRVLAEDQRSTIDVPPCDNSAMDGYAFCFKDIAASGTARNSSNESRELVVSQRIAAGAIGKPLKAGTAARIFTGAAIPEGADTVVMQEDTNAFGEAIRIIDTVKFGQHVRPKGQDIRAGGLVMAKGRRLQPQDIGLLASIGMTSVKVYRQLKVAVLSTGDELVEPGQTLAEGQIYNSNRYTLTALLTAMGCEVLDGGIVADDFERTCQQLKQLSSQADVIISSGGVSVGEEDHVKAAVESLGELALWKLNIKPGKPLAFGTVNGTPFFGLPGNPSSVFVTFCLLAKPYLLAAMGRLK
ncbi:gephyrin-like molybdotransferase Glp [Oceanicoccus sp. KOV_DT_Chl]|uniref:molybdopterin molybdotransferase MoeA n=1 Tax=Oceanicoccus sp. KOV_DT_Chl TaxID=1904639 RepID=UPI001F46F81B|nr:gephyrin-like molybdotransferase Glp [Oceanicoccus sp. KOV_DT_Chl]